MRHTTELTIENRNGERISSLGDWERLAAPAGSDQWRVGRSAYEFARAWIEGNAARRVADLLTTRPEIAGLHLERGFAERKTYFDDIPGGPRNHDLLLVGATDAGRVVVGVEGKADEPFDRPLTGYVKAARRNPRSRAPERLDRLTTAFFGTTLEQDPSLGPFGYQLLSALAGTLADATAFEAQRAVLLIHEFDTPLTRTERHEANARALAAFADRLGAGGIPAAPAWVSPPIGLAPGSAFSGMPFHLAKLRDTVDRSVPLGGTGPATP